jgi:hypothetical protein
MRWGWSLEKNSGGNYQRSASLDLQRPYLVSEDFYSWDKSWVDWSAGTIHRAGKSPFYRWKIIHYPRNNSRASLLENLPIEIEACHS